MTETPDEMDLRVARILPLLSLAQRRVVVSLWHMEFGRWWRVLKYATKHYGVGRRSSFRTIAPLSRYGLVEEIEIRNSAGHSLGKVLHLTNDGYVAAHALRSEFGEVQP